MKSLPATRSLVATVFVALSVLVVSSVAFAATDPNLNQTVNPGTLSTDILQSDGSTPVASPAVNFPAANVSFSCQTSTATLGDDNSRLYVTNLASNNGWTLSMAATGGPTSTWSDGADSYSFNNAADSGCTNGQMTVDPSVGTVTLDCSSSCSDGTVTKGSSAAFESGVTDSATLMSNSDGSAWKGYLTGVDLSQKIPASQPDGSYSLNMTLTITAN